MLMALKLARKGAGRVSPNPLVGCVIVKNGQVVGKGYHKKYGDYHAEVNALKMAGHKARGATLYVNLEPCFHYGKTPPCVDAVIAAGIKRVVIAMQDPNPKTDGRSITKLKRHGIEVCVGVCAKEARELNQYFIHAMTHKQPYVIVKVAQSLDGMITAQKGQRTQITGKRAVDYVQRLRSEVSAVLVGVNTVRVDDPLLTVRNPKKPQPKRIILDSNLSLPHTVNLFGASGGQVILVCALPARHKKVLAFTKRGVVVISDVPRDRQGLDLKYVLKSLYDLGLRSVLVEGGAKVFRSFLTQKLADEWQIITAPVVYGECGLAWMSPDFFARLQLQETRTLGRDKLIVFKCSRVHERLKVQGLRRKVK
ncbi:MAG: Riboflavin biosynthesis protein RibD [uncultured bacterium]|nr:MAG: Riboflavin biosynthesis protein RibD [uncultured bacterium]